MDQLKKEEDWARRVKSHLTNAFILGPLNRQMNILFEQLLPEMETIDHGKPVELDGFLK
jgi:hypothetical protein